MTTDTKPTTLPAYISFKTLLDILKRMRDEGDPTMIDRSYLDNYSGGYVSQILSSFEWLGLIRSDGRLTDKMKTLIRGSDQEQKEMMAQILLEKYPKIFELGESNTTHKQFEDALRELGPKGETLRKAGAFYLHAAKFADVEVGQLWKTPPTTRKRRPTPKQETDKKSPPAEKKDPVSSSDAKSISLHTGETLTLSMSAPLLSLDKGDRQFVLSIVDQLEEYELGIEEAEDDIDDEDDSWETTDDED